MSPWTAFPHDPADYQRSPAALRELWTRLHTGDVEPLPDGADVLAAWAHFHAGRFQQAAEAGLKAGAAGLTVANKAQLVYASYLEPGEQARVALLLDVAARAQAQADAEPGNPNAHYLLACALGRYGKSQNIGKALAQGLGTRVRAALQTAITLAPRHADAHVALGAFHAEVIDKVGSLLGRTQGASKDAGLLMFRTGLKLNPGSASALVEYAHGLLMLEGDQMLGEATALYERAAATLPLDALERLDVEAAKAELAD